MFYIWVKDPTTYEHDDLFYILEVSQFFMRYICMYIYIYIYTCLCLAWTLKHMIDELFFVEQGALVHIGN